MKRADQPGYLGGWNQSLAQKQAHVLTRLQVIPPVKMGWPWQCRCGGTDWTKYRGRYYCWHCGYRFNRPDDLLPGHSLTFRQTFEQLKG